MVAQAQLMLLFSSFLIATSIAQSCPQVQNCLPLLEKGHRCPLFPLLPGTAASAPGPSGFLLTRITAHVFHYSDDAYHAVIAYSPSTKHLAVVDFPRSANSFPPSSPGTYLLVSAVLAVTGGPFHKTVRLLSMVYGHRHFDHIGGAGAFASAVKANNSYTHVRVYGTAETRNYLSRHAGAVPIPTRIVRSGKVSRIVVHPGRTVIKLHVLGGHTRSDIAAVVGELAHFVDVITPGEAPFADFVFTIDFQRYLDVHQDLLRLPWSILSTGHGRLGSKQDVRRNFQFSKFVLKAVEEAARSVNPLPLLQRIADETDVAYRNGGWAFYEIILLQVDFCAKKVVEEWGCRISLVDVFVRSLCQTAAFFNLAEQ